MDDVSKASGWVKRCHYVYFLFSTMTRNLIINLYAFYLGIYSCMDDVSKVMFSGWVMDDM
jgi:hypothetical protein